ncbi:MAG: LysM peptidoglycan-binding domain-containing protein [Opitutaceae bacterium]|jgi:LysM repeat protein|nr:LysM peptidoglycan-binding domain-containing protein [Opitutaceae bacterium]
MRQLRHLLIPSICVGLLLTGCNRLPEGETVAEINEPSYEEGKRLIRQGREQAALASFTRVINTRQDGAPESHLEVGLLYETEVKDPIAAIYHFRRYLELKPNSPQADLVRGRIHGATRDFARTLPAQPLENQNLRNDLLDVVDQLQRENTRLKDEVATLRGNRSTSRGTVADLTVGDERTALPPRQTPPPNPLSRAPISAAPDRTVSRPQRPAATTTTAEPTRVHTVVKGDTLYGLSRRYYQDSTRAKDIYTANRSKMKSQNDLQVGMRLVIPQ